MRKKLNYEEMITFCSQMTLILHSGISAFEGLAIMLEEPQDPQGTALLKQMYAEMEQGKFLWEAMEAEEVFPNYACRMVQLGEVSGRLEDVMCSLTEYYRQQEAFYQSVRHAVSYPLFMLVMMMGVLSVLMIKVMPVFQQVFLSLGTGLTGPAQAVLKLGETMRRSSGALAVVLLLAAAVFFWCSVTQKGKETAKKKLTKWGIVRETVKKTAQYRLAFGMSMSLRSGLDPYRSLELMKDLVEEEETAGKIAAAAEWMQQGKFFEDAIVETKLFDGMQNRMIRMGQRTGTLDQVMAEIAVQCEQEASEKIWNRVSIIEPTIVILLAVLVGVILLSVMLPLMSIMTEIG